MRIRRKPSIFMEFYGREMIRLSERQPLTRIPGEDNELYYIPLGVGVVIPPVELPAGDHGGDDDGFAGRREPVVLKPGQQHGGGLPRKFMKGLQDAGLPDGVVNYVPGPGVEVGEYLVKHPFDPVYRFYGIAGSGPSDQRARCADRSGTEMDQAGRGRDGRERYDRRRRGCGSGSGGSDRRHVGLRLSGQKCSAGSRAIVVEDVYDEVVERGRREDEAAEGCRAKLRVHGSGVR